MNRIHHLFMWTIELKSDFSLIRLLLEVFTIYFIENLTAQFSFSQFSNIELC